MDLLAHAHPSAAFFNLDLIAPVALVALASFCRRGRDAGLLLVAAAAMLAAAVPPLHDLAAGSVTGHMVQHLVIIMIAAPCIGAAAASAPTTVRRTPGLSVVASALTTPLAPLVAGALHALSLVFWHVPGPYDAAVDSWLVHGLEHATLLATGAWWWAAVLHHAPRRAVGVSMVSLFAVATAGAAMGVFMMFAPNPLYGQGGVGDQQTAGAIMAGGTGGVFGAAALHLGARAVSRMAVPRPQRVPTGTRGAATILAVAGCAVLTVGVLVLTDRAGSSASSNAERSAVAPIPSVSAPLPAQSDQPLGADLYRRDCAWCHGPEGAGSFQGTALSGVGTASVRYMLDTGRMPISSSDATVNRSEPAYSREEIDAIVAYLDTLIDGPEALEPDIATAELGPGGEIYRLQCAACHGAEGIGGALAFEGFAPTLQHSAPADVANAMIAGPGAMPAFVATYDEDDIANVAAYVTMLQDPPGTGLAIPGGRVGEGLVAWLAGLGALIVASRWTGARQ